MEGETQKLLHMEERLCEQVIGQNEAVSAVSNAIRRARVGLGDPNRPLGSFLFMGPTGVGKTHLAKSLAEFPFRRRKRYGAYRHERIHGKTHRFADSPVRRRDTSATTKAGNSQKQSDDTRIVLSYSTR